MNQEKFEGLFYVDDGYIAGKRPQHFSLYASDLEDDMTDEDIARFYDEAVEEEFRNRISYIANRTDEFVAWAREQLNKREQQ